MAEGPQGAEHESRIEREQRLGAETQLLDDAGAEILDDHVGVGDVALEPGNGFRILQVEHDRALVHVDGVEGRAAPEGEGRAPAAGLVTLRTLHLHDIRAQVGENLAREGTGEGLGDLDDLDPVQRQRHSHGRAPVSMTS